jgi:peptide/nickel transport system substrate-binding protein
MPIPYRLLNNYYTNQTRRRRCWSRCGAQVGLNVEIQMKENWSQIFDR